MTVRVQSDDSQHPFPVQRSTTVRANGTFAATVALPDINENTTAVISVYRNATKLTDRTAHVESVPSEDKPTTGESPPRFVFDEDRISVYTRTRVMQQSRLLTGREKSCRPGISNRCVELFVSGCIASAPNQTIRGETTFDSGTEVSVRITSTNSSMPFLILSAVSQ
ncbi:MAG: BGTF surface domain-containing protein [Haloarcula sp.]